MMNYKTTLVIAALALSLGTIGMVTMVGTTTVRAEGDSFFCWADNACYNTHKECKNTIPADQDVKCEKRDIMN